MNIKNDSGKCYIATAVYGSYEAPEVFVLRRFRDEVLSMSVIGRIFIGIYYKISPPLAKLLERKNRVNYFMKKILNYLVNTCQKSLNN